MIMITHPTFYNKPLLVVAGCTALLPMIAFLPLSIIPKPCFQMFI